MTNIRRHLLTGNEVEQRKIIREAFRSIFNEVREIELEHSDFLLIAEEEIQAVYDGFASDFKVTSIDEWETDPSQYLDHDR